MVAPITAAASTRYAAACIRGGVQPDLLNDAGWWSPASAVGGHAMMPNTAVDLQERMIAA